VPTVESFAFNSYAPFVLLNLKTRLMLADKCKKTFSKAEGNVFCKQNTVESFVLNLKRAQRFTVLAIYSESDFN
jgi:hypothetical protein